MALIECWECNEKISETAKKCPSCGALADDEPTDIRVWISLIIGGVLFYLIESNFDVNGFWNHTLLFLFFLLGFPIGTIFYLSSKGVGEEKDKREKSINKEIPYKNKELYLDVVGIFASKSRIKEFERVNNTSNICLEEDPYNEHDKYAIKVINCDTKNQIGFLERGQRKLIKSLKHSDYFVQLVNKEQFFSKSSGRDEYKMSIKLFIGFEKEDLDKIIKKAKGDDTE